MTPVSRPLSSTYSSILIHKSYNVYIIINVEFIAYIASSLPEFVSIECSSDSVGSHKVCVSQAFVDVVSSNIDCFQVLIQALLIEPPSYKAVIS